MAAGLFRQGGPEVKLTRKQRKDLQTILRRHKSEQRLFLRASIVWQLFEDNRSESSVARNLRVTPMTVRKWKHRVAGECQEAKKIIIVWDNLNTRHEGPSKRWTQYNEKHGNKFEFHYTPIHASWVNQVETKKKDTRLTGLFAVIPCKDKRKGWPKWTAKWPTSLHLTKSCSC